MHAEAVLDFAESLGLLHIVEELAYSDNPEIAEQATLILDQRSSLEPESGFSFS